MGLGDVITIHFVKRMPKCLYKNKVIVNILYEKTKGMFHIFAVDILFTGFSSSYEYSSNRKYSQMPCN